MSPPFEGRSFCDIFEYFNVISGSLTCLLLKIGFQGKIEMEFGDSQIGPY